MRNLSRKLHCGGSGKPESLGEVGSAGKKGSTRGGGRDLGLGEKGLIAIVIFPPEYGSD